MRLFSLLLLLCASLYPQIPDGITTSATRIVNVPPDQADFVLVVATGLDTTQPQVIQILQDAGISNANVVAQVAGTNGYTYPPATDSQLFYEITFTVAPASLREFAKKLDAMKANLPPGVTAVQYTAALSASAAAVQNAHDTVLPLLLAEARNKAQTLASAGGLKLGSIIGLSETSYILGAISASQYLFASLPGLTGIPGGSTGTQYTFFANVKFASQ